MASSCCQARSLGLHCLVPPPFQFAQIEVRCAKIFQERARLVHGDKRMKKLLDGICEDSGKIQWMQAGPYTLKWHTVGNRELLKEVEHVSGVIAPIPEYMVVDNSCQVFEPVHENLTRFNRPPCASMLLETLFEEDKGPRYLAISRRPPNVLTALALKIKEQEDQGRAATEVAHESFLSEARKQKAEVNAGRLKERIAAHNAKVKRAKAIQLA